MNILTDKIIDRFSRSFWFFVIWKQYVFGLYKRHYYPWGAPVWVANEAYFFPYVVISNAVKSVVKFYKTLIFSSNL